MKMYIFDFKNAKGVRIVKREKKKIKSRQRVFDGLAIPRIKITMKLFLLQPETI